MAGTYSYKIEQRDIDATLRVRLTAMADILLAAAGDDADMLGFGVGDLNAGVGSSGVEASWVLSRMAVEMRRLPARGEVVSVYTWVSDYGRLMTTRNMVVTDGGGQELGAAVTQWAMIDLATRRPLDLSALSNKRTSLVEREPPIEKPRKVGALSGAGNGVGSDAGSVVERLHTVVYSDIDFNGHVNSMKYLEWMVDTLSCESAVPVTAPMRFDINYLHEARLGEALTVCYGLNPADKNKTTFDIRNAEGGSICKAVFAAI